MDTAAVRTEAASAFAVSPEIHEEDMIFQFLVDHPAFPTPSDAARHYFSDGSNSAHQLAAIIDRHYVPSTPRPRLFEFASGFGAVRDIFRVHCRPGRSSVATFTRWRSPSSSRSYTGRPFCPRRILMT